MAKKKPKNMAIEKKKKTMKKVFNGQAMVKRLLMKNKKMKTLLDALGGD